jgi:hypothetical protein
VALGIDSSQRRRSRAFLDGTSTTILTLLLIACILIYDAIHKAVAFSPVLMAGCRLFLYLVAASI